MLCPLCTRQHTVFVVRGIFCSKPAWFHPSSASHGLALRVRGEDAAYVALSAEDSYVQIEQLRGLPRKYDVLKYTNWASKLVAATVDIARTAGLNELRMVHPDSLLIEGVSLGTEEKIQQRLRALYNPDRYTELGIAFQFDKQLGVYRTMI
jgi:hypothetical protein